MSEEEDESATDSSDTDSGATDSSDTDSSDTDSSDTDSSDTDSSEAMRWAAEEPTAMWDESLLEQEGFNKLLKDRSTNPREQTGPATTHQVGGSTSKKIEVSADATGGHAPVAPAGKKRQGLSWALTFGLAVGLGAVVYLVVRLVR